MLFSTKCLKGGKGLKKMYLCVSNFTADDELVNKETNQTN